MTKLDTKVTSYRATKMQPLGLPVLLNGNYVHLNQTKKGSSYHLTSPRVGPTQEQIVNPTKVRFSLRFNNPWAGLVGKAPTCH